MFIIDTKVNFQKARVLLGVQLPNEGLGIVFRKWLMGMVGRAKDFTMTDFYEVHFDLLAKAKRGERLIPE